jgi:hypothetical protein
MEGVEGWKKRKIKGRKEVGMEAGIKKYRVEDEKNGR